MKDYFDDIQDIKIRNSKIKEAMMDGYKQSEIAEFLKLSRTTVSKAIKKVDQIPFFPKTVIAVIQTIFSSSLIFQYFI